MSKLSLEDVEAIMSRNTRKHNPDVVSAMRTAIERVDVYGSEYNWHRRDTQTIGDSDAIQA